MAFDWYRTDAAFFRHPKVFELNKALNQERTGWYVHGLWSWLVTYAKRGRFAKSLADEVERACEWRGTTGQLVAALVSVGLLDDVDETTLGAHDWDEKQGALAEKAEKDAARKRRQRARDKSDKTTRQSADAARAESSDVTRDGAGTKTRRDGTGRDVTNDVPPPVHVIPVPAAPADPYASGEAYFAHVQRQRHDLGGVVERMPRGLSAWWSEVGMELNGEYQLLDAALVRFGKNTYWEKTDPPWPFPAFMKNWRDYVRR